MIELDKITNFVANNYAPARQWPRDITRGFVAWNTGHGFLGMIYGLSDEIVGLAICRPVMNPGDGAVAYCFDPEGKAIFIDLFIARSPNAMLGLSYIFRHRFGERQQVAYFRFPETALRIHSYKAFVRNIERGRERIMNEYLLTSIGET